MTWFKSIPTALTLLCLALPARAEVAACYALTDPSDGIGEMTVTAGGSLNYSQAGQPFIVYTDFCNLRENETTHCPRECDGGSLYYTHSADGLLVEGQGFRVESMQFDSVLNMSFVIDADGVQLYGKWLLKPADPSVCQELETKAPDVAFTAGDLHPRVEQLETYLLAGGYFLQGPDMVFDAATTTAVRAYQRDVGLPETGVVDRDLLRRIGVDAILAFGGG